MLLANISPRDVAERVRGLLRAAAVRLGATLDTAPLERDAEALATYAQTGAGLTTDQAHSALGRVVGALYSRARDEAPPGLDVLGEEGDDDPLGLALRGAWGRWRLAAGHEVDLPTLGVLAGIVRQKVHEAVSGGALKASKGSSGRAHVVAAVSARAWLEERGGDGFSAKKKRQ